MSGLEQLILSGLYAPPRPRKPVFNLSWTGGAIFGSTITLATVAKTGRAGLRFDGERSLQFHLPKRDQPSVQRVHAALQRFVYSARIGEIVLRTTPRGTEFRTRTEANICEAALYLLSKVQVHQLSAPTLRTWMQQQGFEAPSQARDRYWQVAVAVALYSAEKEGVKVVQLEP